MLSPEFLCLWYALEAELNRVTGVTGPESDVHVTTFMVREEGIEIELVDQDGAVDGDEGHENEEPRRVMAVKLNALILEHIGAGIVRTTVLSCRVFDFGVYVLCFGALTTYNERGELTFSVIGRWVGNVGNDPRPYRGRYL